MERRTRETIVSLSLDLDGGGRYEVSTGIGMFDHMLEQLARHSLVDLRIDATGDIERDPHLHVDSSRKRACPKCSGVKLKRRYFSAKRRIEIDECPGCGGYWLDAGELEKIRDEMDQVARENEAQAAGQMQRSRGEARLSGFLMELPMGHPLRERLGIVEVSRGGRGPFFAVSG